MKRSAIVLVLSGIALLFAYESVWAQPQPTFPPNSVWKLPSSDYPLAALVADSRENTNNDATLLLGPSHHTSLSDLGRLDKRGWIQAGYIKRRIVQGNGRVSVGRVVWLYVVSYYPTSALAHAAVADIRLKTSPLTGSGTYGRTSTYRDNGIQVIEDAFGSGNITVEQLCWLGRGNHGQGVKLLAHYADMQRIHLSSLLRGIFSK